MPLRFAQLYRAVPPTVEPVTVAEVKAQLRLLHSDDDDDLAFMIEAAREWAEDYTSRSLIYQSWVALFPGWPAVDDRTILLPRPQLSVVELFRYRDINDDWVELSEEDDFTVDEIEGSIRLRDAFTWPTLSKDRVNPLEVVFRAGYGDAASDVPMRFKQAIRLAVASAYGEDRSNSRSKVSFRAPSVAESLLSTLRVRPV